jgi:TldD protein
MKQFALNIIDVLKTRNLTYGDCRVVETTSEELLVRNGIVETVVRTTDLGFGVRVLKGNGWGFSSSRELAAGEADTVIAEAVAIAESSASVPRTPVRLSELPRQVGTYKTSYATDPFAVPLSDKIDLLVKAESILRQHPDVKQGYANMSFLRIRKVFVSTEGSVIEQELLYSGAGLTCLAIRDGEMQRRSYPGSFGGNVAQAGYEFVLAMELVPHGDRVRDEVVQLLAAPVCPEGRMDVIIGTNQLGLQIHESIGHPSELDRVLGTEESYAGKSFATLEKFGKFQYGSQQVNVFADATVPGGLGTFGYDDEGVPAQRVPLIKGGIFTNYLTSRETAPVVGLASNGTMRASGWNRIPLIRMTNINLEPGTWDFDALVADTKQGLFVDTNKSWSIDDRRLNFQFGTEIAWKIEDGKIGEVVKYPLYTGITPEFWNSCDAICAPKHWVLWGIPNCGKGEPGQTAYVGHGTAPARFRNVQVRPAK